MSKIMIIFYVFAFVSCSTATKSKREFLDSSTHSDSPPEWVQDQRISWEKNGEVFFRTAYELRPNERVNACYTLAKMDTKETLLTSLASDVRGRIDNAITSISDSAEIVLGQVRSEEYKGRIIGLKSEQTYYERYKIDGDEKLSCYVLSKISKGDYDRVKREVVNKIVEVDPRIREAIAKKQIEFFDNRNPSSNQ